MEIPTRSLQNELLKMMKSFHNICVENNLKYYMLGGTCLGAARHSGFIPWDDDMDVGMPRKDYEKFCSLAHDILPNSLELKYYRTDSNSPFHFVKLVNKNTTLIEPNYLDYIEGIYIDVFPLDNQSDTGFLNALRDNMIWLLHASIINHCSTVHKTSLFKKVFSSFSKRLDLNRMHNCLEFLMTLEKRNPVYMCNYLGAWKEKEIVPKEIFGAPTLYSFEDTFFFGPKDIHGYLTHLYGDYNVLPPKEEQVCRHNYYYINLELPYKEYALDQNRDC